MSCRDRPDRGDELVERGVLEKEARDAGVHELHDLLVDRNDVHDDDLHAGAIAAEGHGDVQTFLIAEPDVEKQHVRRRRGEKGRIGRRRCYDTYVG